MRPALKRIQLSLVSIWNRPCRHSSQRRPQNHFSEKPVKLIIDFEHRLKRLYYTETKEREYNSSNRCARSQLTRCGGICGCLLGFILSLATHHLYYKYVSFSMLKAVRANRIYTTSATKLKPYQAKKYLSAKATFYHVPLPANTFKLSQSSFLPFSLVSSLSPPVPVFLKSHSKTSAPR